MTDLTNLF